MSAAPGAGSQGSRGAGRARELGAAQAQQDTGSRGRFWSGIALLAGGTTLAVLSGFEIGDDDDSPDAYDVKMMKLLESLEGE